MLDLLGVDALVAPADLADFAAFMAARHGSDAPDVEALAREGGFEPCFSGEARVYCRERRLSRAFLADQARLLPGDGPGRVFVRRHGNDPVRFLKDAPGEVELELEASRPSFLVLADTFYPGWEARLDGRPVEILLAQGLVRAVGVPAGRHRVRFVFRPRAFHAGLAVSVIALAAALVLRWRRL
jgi:hypothetical protein